MRITEVLSQNGINYTQKERDNIYCECPYCGSDKLSISTSTGLFHCWSADCEEKGNFAKLAKTMNLDSSHVELSKENPIRNKTLSDTDRAAILSAAQNKVEVLEWSASRGLDGNFVLSQGIGYDTHHRAIVFPFRDEKGILVGAKYKASDRQWIVGKEPLLYILDTKDLKKDKIVIVEGEVDALTLKGFGIPCAAVLGASKSKGFELLSSVRQLYLGFDMDDAGQAGAEAAAKSLGSYRCRTITWEAKDVNDWLQAGATKEQIIQALRDAKAVVSDSASLSLFDALNEYIEEQDKDGGKRRSWGFERLDSFTKGLGGGEMVGVLAESGTGKTTFIINVIRNHVLQGISCGFASLEEHPIHEITPKLYSCLLGRNLNSYRLSREDAASIEPDLKRIQLYKGKVDLKSVLEWAKECYYLHDCKMVAIDYFQLLVKDEESTQAIKETIFEIKNLTKECPELCVLLVIQPKQASSWRRSDGSEAPPPKLNGTSARGGSAINQTVDKMLTIKGVNGHANITQYEFTKVRGHLNVSKREWLNKFTQLEYDHNTLRMKEVENLTYGY